MTLKLLWTPCYEKPEGRLARGTCPPSHPLCTPFSPLLSTHPPGPCGYPGRDSGTRRADPTHVAAEWTPIDFTFN